jgi:Ca-activated chloride channel homolog
LGLGTVAGAPVSGKEGFRTGADGRVQLARLDAASLSALAADGGGRYAGLTQDDADLRALDVLDPQGRTQSDRSVTPITTDASAQQNVGVQRSDDGVWLLLLLLPLALIGFRRGWLAVLPLSVLGVMTPSQPASAASEQSQTTQATVDRRWEWASLWQRDDQRAHQALQQGAVDTARTLAQDPALQGAAAYRGNDYATAAKTWAGMDNADAHYNRGNALANAGNYEDALAAYDEALKRTPDMPDALANRKAVEDLLKQQQKQQQDQQQDGDASQSQKQDGDASSSEDSSPTNGSPQQQEEKDAESAQQDNKDSKQADQAGGEQSKSDDQQGQQADQPQSAESKGPQQAGAQGDEQKQDRNGKPENSNDRDGEQGEDDASDNKPAPSTAEAAAEQQAKEAAKRAMEQALAQGKSSPAEKQPDGQPAPVAAPALTEQQRAESEQQQAVQQWLRRVPDDPGGLLRRKFALEYQRRQAEGEDQ